MEIGLSDALSALALAVSAYSAFLARSVARREAMRDTERIKVEPLIGSVGEDSYRLAIQVTNHSSRPVVVNLLGARLKRRGWRDWRDPRRLVFSPDRAFGPQLPERIEPGASSAFLLTASAVDEIRAEAATHLFAQTQGGSYAQAVGCLRVFHDDPRRTATREELEEALDRRGGNLIFSDRGYPLGRFRD